MPQVVAAAFAVLGKVGAAAASLVGATIAAGSTAAIAIGGAIVAGSALVLRNLYEIELPKIDTDGSRQNTVRSTVEARKLVYGEALISGPLTYVGVSGTNNADLYQVIALAGHEVDAITDIHFDDVVIANSDIGSGSASGGTVGGSGTFGSTTAPFVTINKFKGLATQTASTLLSAQFTNYTADHRGDGVAYIAMKWTLNEDTSQVWDDFAPQNIKALVRGKKVYDPRLDTTQTDIPGSGSHRVNDPSTWAYSDNPALCCADYLLDDDFGLNIPASKIDYVAVADAADYCDENATIPDGQGGTTTEKRFTCNGVIFGTDSHQTNIDKILSSMMGTVTYVNGKYIIRTNQRETFSVEFDDNDLAGAVAINTSAERGDRFNTVKGVFIDPDSNHKNTDFPEMQIATLVTRDNGQRLEKQIQLPMTNSSYMAQRIAYRSIAQTDLQRVITVPVNLKGLNVRVGDTVRLNLSDLDIVDEDYKCISWSFSETGGVNLVLQQQDVAGATQGSAFQDPASGLYSTFSVYTGEIDSSGSTIYAPTSLAAVPTPAGIQLTWTPPTFTKNLKQYEIYASDNNQWANAAAIGTTLSSNFLYNLTPGSTKYFWVRAIGESTTLLSDRAPDSDTSTVSATAIAPTRVFQQTDAPTGGTYTSQDIWIDTDGDYKTYVWDGSQWVEASSAAAALTAAQNAQSTADGKIVTFYQDDEPAANASSEGDLWIDTNDNNKLYRYNSQGGDPETFAWDLARDAGIATAISDASTAQSTADGKITTFFAASGAPPTADAIGDLWWTTDTKKFYRAESAGADEITSGEWVITNIVAETIDSQGNLATQDSVDYTSSEVTNTPTSLTDINVGEYSSLQSITSIPLVIPGGNSQTVTQVGLDVQSSGNEGAGAWSTQFYSKDASVGGCAVTFTVGSASSRYMIGLNSDPTFNASFNSIDYAWYVRGSGGDYRIYESGTNIQTVSATPTAGDVLVIGYDGTTIRYMLNGVVQRSVVPTTQPSSLALDSSIDGIGSQHTTIIKNINFINIGATLPTLGTNVLAEDGSTILADEDLRNSALDVSTTNSTLSITYGSNTSTGVTLDASSNIDNALYYTAGATEFTGEIDATHNSILAAAASDPTGQTGEFYYNTTDKQWKYYDGSAWVAVSTFNTGDLADKDAVDLTTTEVTGTLPVGSGGTGITDFSVAAYANANIDYANDGSGTLPAAQGGTGINNFALSPKTGAGNPNTNSVAADYTGQFYYDSTDKGWWYHDGSAWVNVGDLTASNTANDTANVDGTAAADVAAGAAAGTGLISNDDTVVLDITSLDGDYYGFDIGGIHAKDGAIYTGQKATFPSATTAGFYLGSDGQFAISDGTQNVLSFDPANPNLKIQGSITAGSGSNTAALSGTEAYRFWAGSDNPALGTFRVDSQGQVVATNFILTDANNNILFSTADGFEPLAITQIAAGSGEAAKVTEYAESLTGDTDDIQITLSQTSNIQIKVRITCFWYGAEFAATDAAARTAAENELLQSVNLLVGYSATSGGAFTSSQNQTYTKVIDSATPTSTQINVETATSYDAESGTYLGTAVPLAGSGALNANKEIIYTATFNNVAAGTYYVRSTVTATNDTATGGAGSASSNLKASNDSTYSRTVSIIDNTTDGGFTVDGGANQTVGGGDITSVSITANNGISGGGTVSSGAASFTLGLGNITPTAVTSTGKLQGTWAEFTTTNSTDPGTDDLNASGYGIIGNRASNPVYVHNNGAGGVRISSNDGLGTANGVLITDTSATFAGTISSGAITSTGNSVFSGDTQHIIFNEPANDADWQTVARFGTAAAGVYITSANPLITSGGYYNGGWISTQTYGAQIDLYHDSGGIAFRGFNNVTVPNAPTYANLLAIDKSGNGTFTGTISSSALSVSGVHSGGFDVANFYSATTQANLNIGRNSSERLNFYVTDSQAYIRYYQDETGGSNHSVNFEIQSSSTGTNQFYFNKGVNVTGNVTATGGTAVEDAIRTTNGRMRLGHHQSGAGIWFDTSSVDQYWFAGLTGDNFRLYQSGDKFTLTPAGNLTISGTFQSGSTLNIAAGALQLGGTTAIDSSRNVTAVGLTSSTLKLGQTSQSLENFTAVADWAKPAGYSSMLRGLNQNANVVGTPVSANYWLYNVFAKRDTGGGTAGLLLNYDNGDFYTGFWATSSTTPSWKKVVHDGSSPSLAALTVTGDADMGSGHFGASAEIGIGDAAVAYTSVGHDASVNEGIFWHSSATSYGIWREAGTWASPSYPPLVLNWPTGIKINGGSGSNGYTYEGVTIESPTTFTGAATFETTLSITGADGESALLLSGASPTMEFRDTTSGADDFYIHINSNNFYILADRGSGGGYGNWETPYPLLLEADTNIGYLFDQRIFNDAYHPNADTWTTSRTLTIGDTGKSVNGSADVAWSRAELGITKANIDALNINADLLDGLNYLDFNRAAAQFRTAASNSTRVRVTLPFNTNSGKMIKFTVSWYAGYVQRDYEISGYLYPTTNNWYLPRVVQKGSDANNDVIFGRDANGKAYVSFPGGNYQGVVVHSVTAGYTMTTAEIYTTGWTITLNNGSENNSTGASNGTPSINRIFADAYHPNADTLTTSRSIGISGAVSGSVSFNGSADVTISSTANAPLSYIDAATGSFGTIKVDDDRGVTWAGYAIRDDWVFMSNGAGRCGIYNDTDNEWMLEIYQNAQIDMRHNGTIRLSTTSTGVNCNGSYSINQATSTGRDRGIIGTYSPSYLALIWTMGAAYNISADGNSGGDLYGWNYSYNPDYGFAGANPGAISGLGHQTQWRANGATQTAIGTGIYTIGNVTAYSDRRVKTNIERIPNALEKVNKINGYTFDRTDMPKDAVTGEQRTLRQTGVIAQELLEVLPEAVTGSEEHHYAVAYGNLAGLFIEAIKELTDKVEELERKLEEKENGDN